MILINEKRAIAIFKLAVLSIFFVTFSLGLSNCTSKPKQVLTSAEESTLKKDSVEKFKLNCGCMRVSGIKFNRDSLFTQVEINPEPPGGMKAFREMDYSKL